MILKLTTNEKKTEIWVNLQQVVQITTITVRRAALDFSR
jgi:hypothetical protein